MLNSTAMTGGVRVQRRRYQCHAHIVVDVLENLDKGLLMCIRHPGLVGRRAKKY